MSFNYITKKLSYNSIYISISLLYSSLKTANDAKRFLSFILSNLFICCKGTLFCKISKKNPELTGFFFLLFLHIKLKIQFLFIAEGVAYPNGERLVSF